MAEFNIHQKWGNSVNDAYRGAKRKAKEANAVPYGKERLTGAEAKTRFLAKDEAGKKQELQERGQKGILDILRG